MNERRDANDLFAPVAVSLEARDDGSMVFRSKTPLGPYPPTVCHYLEHWAATAPDRPFLVERDAAGAWRPITFAQARSDARKVAAWLLGRGLDAHTPVMLLSENTIEHALMQFGAMYAGVPVAPVSPAYALQSKDFGKLRHIAGLLEPAIVFAQDGAAYAGAIASAGLDEDRVVCVRNGASPRTVPFDMVLGASDDASVDRALAATGPDDIAKILFTSGSTGLPKGVVNTHRMMCSNQQALAQAWPFVERRPPVLVDWLPWNHTFGGNHNLNMIARNGGTLYIDAGKPAPGLVGRTVANLRSVAPSVYFNVPRGYDMLVPELEADAAFRDHFFSRLDLVFYAAAALPQTLWERLEALSLASTGTKIAMTSAWGSTETAPMATSAHYPLTRAGNIGVPVPGTEIKLVPNGGKLELLVRGPNVTPGYFRRPDLTQAAFDAEGFYRIGDAGRFEDPDDPARGIVFDGRVAEDFKLLTGTWVSTGALRIAAIAACSPLFQDVVVTGHDRDEIGLLVFPNPAAMAARAGRPADTPADRLVCDPLVVEAVREGLSRHNEDNPAATTRIARALIMSEPPLIDANEITDKGYINQRAVLERRRALVERLHSGDPHPDIVVA